MNAPNRFHTQISAGTSAQGIELLDAALDECGSAQPFAVLEQLRKSHCDVLPMPGSGKTLERWQALALVASYDLSLAKLFEGHTDALAIFQELAREPGYPAPTDSTWGMWAADAPSARIEITNDPSGQGVRLNGIKSWCSGAGRVSYGLMTAWRADEGPFLVAVPMQQAGVRVIDDAWKAVGMHDSGSFEVELTDASGELFGAAGDYLNRPGFWHGGAGIAACWYGGALGLARHLHERAAVRHDALTLAHLGNVDIALSQTAAILRAAAASIDEAPLADARILALRCRASAEATARCVLDHAGQAMGAHPYCRDERFARLAADLPVFVRQSHGQRDLAALGESLLGQEQVSSWAL